MKKLFQSNIRVYLKKCVLIGLTLCSSAAFASMDGPSMPWDGPLEQVQNALSGNTAHAAIVIGIILGGLGFAVGEHGSLQRKAMAVIIGGSIAVGATSLYTSLSFHGA